MAVQTPRRTLPVSGNSRFKTRYYPGFKSGKMKKPAWCWLIWKWNILY